MIVIYAFYADIFFLQNLLTDAIVLSVVAAVRKEYQKKRWLRILAASSAGSVLSLCLLLAGSGYLLFLILSYVAVFPLTVWIAFGTERIRTFLGNCVLALLAAVLLGGLLETAELNFGLGRLWLLCALAAGIFIRAALRYLFWIMQRRKHLFPVRLFHGGRTFSGMALYDSGNFLREPYGGATVQIVSEEVFDRLTEGDGQLPGWIPYRAIGTESGLLETAVFERIRLENGRDTAEFQNVTVAKAPGKLLGGKDYQVILNQNIWEMRGMEYGKKDRKCHKKTNSLAEKRRD